MTVGVVSSSGPSDTDPAGYGCRACVRCLRGDDQSTDADFAAARPLDQASFITSAVSSAALVAGAYAGSVELDHLERARSMALAMKEDNPKGDWDLLLHVAESLAVLGRKPDAGNLYPALVRGLERGSCVSLISSRFWQMVAGIAAACGRQWDAAQEHYETALKQAHDLPHEIAPSEVRR